MRLIFTLVLCLSAFASNARAHLDLKVPVSRHGSDILKDGPCGKPDSVRTSNVTTFAPGETIEVRWDEYVDHPGHFRIAFDADDDNDFIDPATMMEFNSNAAVLMDNIQDTVGGETSVQVTLPDIECDSCTFK